MWQEYPYSFIYFLDKGHINVYFHIFIILHTVLTHKKLQLEVVQIGHKFSS